MWNRLIFIIRYVKYKVKMPLVMEWWGNRLESWNKVVITCMTSRGAAGRLWSVMFWCARSKQKFVKRDGSSFRRCPCIYSKFHEMFSTKLWQIIWTFGNCAHAGCRRCSPRNTKIRGLPVRWPFWRDTVSKVVGSWAKWLQVTRHRCATWLRNRSSSPMSGGTPHRRKSTDSSRSFQPASSRAQSVGQTMSFAFWILASRHNHKLSSLFWDHEETSSRDPEQKARHAHSRTCVASWQCSAAHRCSNWSPHRVVWLRTIRPLPLQLRLRAKWLSSVPEPEEVSCWPTFPQRWWASKKQWRSGCLHWWPRSTRRGHRNLCPVMINALIMVETV